MSRIVRTSLIVTIFTVAELGLGFLSNVVIAAKFGAGREMDVFLAATTLPLFIITILSGSLNFTFIPVFAEYRAKDPQEIWKVVSSFVNLNIVVTSMVCILGMIFAYPLVKLLTPGFSEEKLIKSAELLQWLFPMIIFTAVNQLMASVYYSNQKFVIPSFNKIIGPLLTIIYVSLFQNSLSTKSIVLAMLSATCIQMVLLAGGFLRTHDFHYSFVFDYKHPGVIKILKLMTPLVLGMVVYRGIALYDRFVLSLLPEGSISIFNYSNKIIASILPLVVTGISTTVFPVISGYYIAKNMGLFKQRLEEVLRVLMVVTMPIIVFVVMFAGDVVKIIFERGSFNHPVTLQVSAILSLQITVLFPMAAGTILGLCFYATQNTRISTILGTLEAILYMAICYPLTVHMGLHGMVYATMFDWFLSLVLSMIVLSRILDWNLQAIVKYFLKIVFCGVILFIFLKFLKSNDISMYLSFLLYVILLFLLLSVLSINSEIKMIAKILLKRV